MTVSQVIQAVDEVKPNAFSNEEKTRWLNEVEGMVQTEVLLFASEEVITYSYEQDKDAGAPGTAAPRQALSGLSGGPCGLRQRGV